MKIPVTWLKDYVNYEGDVDSLGHALTMSGTKLEALEIVGSELENLYVGEIVACVEHPDADHLRVCEVHLGDLDLKTFGIESDNAQIICGAPNVAAGQKVIVAVPGAVLPGGFKIGARKLRGIKSYGMICSLTELGFDPSQVREGAADGIEVLPDSAVPGEPVNELLGLGEAILEFEITSNRPDCLSVEGIGRETAVTYGLDFKPTLPVVRGGSTWDGDPMQINVDAEEGCRVYCGRYIKDVVIEPSPLWMQHRLRDAGIRPINNYVDITNYVLLAIGQPLHAFDAEFLEGNEIHVRYAEDEELFKTLDGQTRKLTTEDLVIADAVKPVALAGVMGGEDSEIRSTTKNVFLEAANFTPAGIGRTSRRLNLRSESSSRFDKGLDPELPRRALDLAAELVETLGAGTVCDEIYEARGIEAETPVVPLDPDRINAHLGTDIETSWMVNTLEALGCEVDGNDVRPPSWRIDLNLNADLAEEIARFYGYNEIEATLPTIPGEVLSGLNERQIRKERVRDLCTAYQCYETMTHPFNREETLQNLGISGIEDKRVKIRDAGREYSRLRDRLLPSMLATASLNYRRSKTISNFFEIGRSFIDVPDEEGLPTEVEHLAVLMMLEDEVEDVLFRSQIGLLHELTTILGIEGEWSTHELSREEYPYFHPYRSAHISFDGEILGELAYLHPELLDEHDINAVVCYLEIRLDDLLDKPYRRIQEAVVSRYPSMERDLALVVQESVPAGDLLKELKQAAGALLESATLFDIYRGKSLDDDEKSLALHFVFTHPERTLEEAEVSRAMQDILHRAEEKFSARIRS